MRSFVELVCKTLCDKRRFECSAETGGKGFLYELDLNMHTNIDNDKTNLKNMNDFSIYSVFNTPFGFKLNSVLYNMIVSHHSATSKALLYT